MLNDNLLLKTQDWVFVKLLFALSIWDSKFKSGSGIEVSAASSIKFS